MLCTQKTRKPVLRLVLSHLSAVNSYSGKEEKWKREALTLIPRDPIKRVTITITRGSQRMNRCHVNWTKRLLQKNLSEIINRYTNIWEQTWSGNECSVSLPTWYEVNREDMLRVQIIHVAQRYTLKEVDFDVKNICVSYLTPKSK